MVTSNLAATTNSNWYFLICNNKVLPKSFFIDAIHFKKQTSTSLSIHYAGNIVCYTTTITFSELFRIINTFSKGVVYMLPSCIFLGAAYNLTFFTHTRLQSLITYMPGRTPVTILRSLSFPMYALLFILLIKFIQNYLIIYNNA